MHFAQFGSLMFTLLVISNPLGNLPIFMSLTAGKSEEEIRKTAMHIGISIFITLTVIAWSGTLILRFFGISLPAFDVAGGIVVLLIGLSMLQKKNHIEGAMSSLQPNTDNTSIVVVPMTIPIFAGPATMTVLMMHMHQYVGVMPKLYVTGGLVAIGAVIATVLYFASAVRKVLGPTGIDVVSRLMGLILMAVAVGMMASGLHTLFPGLMG